MLSLLIPRHRDICFCQDPVLATVRLKGNHLRGYEEVRHLVGWEGDAGSEAGVNQGSGKGHGKSTGERATAAVGGAKRPGWRP